MTTETLALPLLTSSRAEHVWPTLTSAQISRVAARGRRRRVERGEVLIEPGEPSTRMFVVTEGTIEIIRTTDGIEQLVVVFGPGMFSGEGAMLTGRPVVVRIRGGEPGEVIELDRDALLSLIQTDSELSEILMRAFILRRLELIARGYGDVVLVGSTHCAATLRIKEFLTRNGHPYTYVDLDVIATCRSCSTGFNHHGRHPGAHLSRHCRPPQPDERPDRRLPRVQRRDRSDARARCRRHWRGSVRVLGRRVCGLRGTRCARRRIERHPAARPGSSSRIENYLGFPDGISGQDLAAARYGRRRSSARRS